MVFDRHGNRVDIHRLHVVNIKTGTVYTVTHPINANGVPTLRRRGKRGAGDVGPYIEFEPKKHERAEIQPPSIVVQLWNERHLVGTLVRLRHDNGDAPLVRTRSEAFLSESGEAVCFFEGISGYYLLDRATPVADHEHGLV